MKYFSKCLFSPRLYKIYGDGPKEKPYQPHILEKWGDKLILSARTLMNVAFYTSPFIATFIYKRGFFTPNESQVLLRIIGGLGGLLGLCFVMRAVGRAWNPKYLQFLRTLEGPQDDKAAYLDAIRKYDFDFRIWPVSHTLPANSRPRDACYNRPFYDRSANPHLPFFKRLLVQGLAYLIGHTLVIRLVYPGCLSIVQHLLMPSVHIGRTHLVETYQGKRAKLLTAEGNSVDTMFVDKRRSSDKGHILVVCCEGNSGFYEIGIMTTPIKAGYSSLGWNHPGFIGSTGLPYPEQEQSAIDAVMHFAIRDLGFRPEDITIMGWSIGGYTASWAAIHYPDIKCLILDATFDDLLPLAELHVPRSWKALVTEVIRSHVNLNIAEMLNNYTGSIHIVRRTEDEVICTRPGKLITNRGNFLLMKLLIQREEAIFGPAGDEQCAVAIRKFVPLSDSQRMTFLREHEIRATRIIRRYMTDYRTSHCVPLSDTIFCRIMESLEE